MSKSLFQYLSPKRAGYSVLATVRVGSCGSTTATVEYRRMSGIEAINRIPVSFEDLWSVMGDTEQWPGEQTFEAACFLIAERFKGEPQKAGAVMLRMQALARLIGNNGAPGWTLPKQPDGGIPTQEWLVAAAAVEPLIERGKQVEFDRDSFLRRTLELAESEGTA